MRFVIGESFRMISPHCGGYGNSIEGYACRSKEVGKIARIATSAVAGHKEMLISYYACCSYPVRSTTLAVVSDVFFCHSKPSRVGGLLICMNYVERIAWKCPTCHRNHPDHTTLKRTGYTCSGARPCVFQRLARLPTMRVLLCSALLPISIRVGASISKARTNLRYCFHDTAQQYPSATYGRMRSSQGMPHRLAQKQG
jgi:hypothetical protein